ncbi:hypothetical protein [Microbulbifer sp. PSTR4-B]|uniref:hypothetical protein n=1 Tax=unclassified Microbulbifer TaxID=2619833 RepID=UPI00403ACBF9
MLVKTEDGRVFESIHIFASNEQRARLAAEAAGIPWSRCRYVHNVKALRRCYNRPVWFVRGWYQRADAYDVERAMELRKCYAVHQVRTVLSVDFAELERKARELASLAAVAQPKTVEDWRVNLSRLFFYTWVAGFCRAVGGARD